MQLRKNCLAAVILPVAIVACSSTPAATPTAAPDLTAEAERTSVAATDAAIDAQATVAASTEEVVSQKATEREATRVQNSTNAAKQEATREAAIAAAKAESTVQADGMQTLVQDLQDRGYLDSTTGSYFLLDDFDESWAQIDWYQWWNSGYTPSDFVVRADASWDSASDRANWWNSGCGFVFREEGVSNHYLAYLGLDGYVYFDRTVNGTYAHLGSSYYGNVGTPSGGAELMLVVEGPSISFFVNGEHVHSRQDQGLSSGSLALTLLSGINKDFGTRCQMSNIELFELD